MLLLQVEVSPQFQSRCEPSAGLQLHRLSSASSHPRVELARIRVAPPGSSGVSALLVAGGNFRNCPIIADFFHNSKFCPSFESIST